MLLIRGPGAVAEVVKKNTGNAQADDEEESSSSEEESSSDDDDESSRGGEEVGRGKATAPGDRGKGSAFCVDKILQCLFKTSIPAFETRDMLPPAYTCFEGYVENR
eukprot:1137535-Pyramimonas_sp.AAC.2